MTSTIKKNINHSKLFLVYALKFRTYNVDNAISLQLDILLISPQRFLFIIYMYTEKEKCLKRKWYFLYHNLVFYESVKVYISWFSTFLTQEKKTQFWLVWAKCFDFNASHNLYKDLITFQGQHAYYVQLLSLLKATPRGDT